MISLTLLVWIVLTGILFWLVAGMAQAFTRTLWAHWKKQHPEQFLPENKETNSPVSEREEMQALHVSD